MNLKFNYQVPIMEKGLIDDEFIIQGTALNAVTTSNNHKFLAEELKPAAKTLGGVPLLKDHTNEVEAVMGRVLKGTFMEAEKRIDFKATVIDKTMQGMINDGRIDSVSVGANVEELEETDDGFFIPRGINFRELSLVAVGADEGATFGVALQEAYNSKLTLGKTPEGEEMSKGKMGEEEDKKAEEEIKKAEEEKKAEAAKAEETKKAEDAKAEESSKILKILERVDGRLKKLEEADEDDKDAEAKKKEKDEAVAKKAEEEKKAEDEEAAKKAAEEKKAEDEAAAEEKGKYTIEQGAGTLRGGSFTLVRT